VQTDAIAAAQGSPLRPTSRALVSLRLRNNPLGETGVREVGAALARAAPLILHSLGLASIGASDGSVAALVGVLAHGAANMPPAPGAIHIYRLDLSHNSLGAGAAAALSTLLRSPGAQLCELTLGNNALGDAGVAALAMGGSQSLKQCHLVD